MSQHSMFVYTMSWQKWPRIGSLHYLLPLSAILPHQNYGITGRVVDAAVSPTMEFGWSSPDYRKHDIDFCKLFMEINWGCLELDEELAAFSGKFEKMKTMFDECCNLKRLPSPQTYTRAT